MTPVNEFAKRVLEYRDLHCLNPGFPSRLINFDGDIFLPAHPSYRHGGRQLPPAEEHATDDMPRYRLIGPVELAGVRHQSGAEIALLGWPTVSMQPLNEPAKRIAAYLARHEGNTKLPRSPWCCYRAGPYLPALTVDEAAQVSERLRHEPRPTLRPPRRRGAAPRIVAA
jgi:hypothetical protein